MITCTKRYDDFPFAHRQPNHDGHCALIHGHNWGIEFEFAATQLDECGFVIDFGKLKWLKDWLNALFDHTLVLNVTDPWLGFLEDRLMRAAKPMAKIVKVPDCSCEGLAAWLLDKVNAVVHEHTDGRVFVRRVTVIEDSKNSATATR